MTDFKNKVFAAPMAGFTDSAMRRLCASFGADFTVTEMISAKAMCYGDKKTAALAKTGEGEGEVIIQLFGHEPECMARAAEMLAGGELAVCSFASKPAAIDINMGCPVRKIVSSGDGSAIMKNPVLAFEIVGAVVKRLEKYTMPVTVKIRAGWDKNSINAVEVARAVEGAGAAAVTVHARTREQMYAPFANWDIIRQVKEALPGFCVIGNGDIKSGADAVKMKNDTGCDSVMVGREALGDPWIFSEIKTAFSGGNFTPPDMDDRIKTALSLIKSVIDEKGEAAGVRESRSRGAYFIKGIRGSSRVRDLINHAETYGEIEKIILTELDPERGSFKTED